MRSPLIIAGAVAFVAILTLLKLRSKPKSRVARAKESVEDTIADLEGRLEQIQKRAKKAGGKAKARIQEEAKELETHERELRARLEDLGQDASKLLERARAWR